MKKVMAVLAIASCVGVASADIALDYWNDAGVLNGGFLGADGFGTATAQLIWSATAPALDGSMFVDSAYGLNSGEYLLQTVNTSAGYAGTWSDQASSLSGLLFGDSDVGGSDINTGYLYVRFYDDAFGNGSYGLVQAIDVSGSLTEFDALTPSTTYSSNGLLGGTIVDAAGTAGQFEVVPEPATIGLMGIAGLGMFLARRKARR